MVDVLQSLADVLTPYADNDEGLITFQHHRNGFYSSIGVMPYVAKTASYTLTENDEVVNVDATAGAATMTLPAAATTRIGKVYTIRKSDTSVNAVIVDGNSAETIDGDTTQILFTQNSRLTIVNTGTAWVIKDSYGVVNGRIFIATANVTHANSTTETSIIGTGVGSLTLPANVLRIAKSILSDLSGFLSCTGTPTLNIRLKLGSTTIAATGAITLETGLANAILSVHALLTCRTVGGSGTVIASGTVSLGTKVFNLHPVSGAAVTIDTTASQVLSITAEWGTMDAANTLTVPESIISWAA